MNAFRLVIAVICLASAPRFASGQAPVAASQSKRPDLPGLQTGPAPWTNGMDRLTERLSAIGIPAMPSEGMALHAHQQLRITIRGKPVTVPAGIGINPILRYISPLHTHDSTGTIHIESATRQPYTLGQFFDVWGLRFDSRCIGAYCTGGADSLEVLSNGRPVQGDPRQLPLEDHETIQILFRKAPPSSSKAPASGTAKRR